MFDQSNDDRLIKESDNHNDGLTSMENMNSEEGIEAESSSIESKKRKWVLVIAIMVLLIGLGIGAYFPISNVIKEYEEAERVRLVKEALNNCLAEVDSLNNDKKMAEKYTAKIECYEKNNIEGYKDKIAELKNKLNQQNLNDCLSKTYSDYRVTDEEKAAVSSLVAAAEITTRINNGMSAQITCYEVYGEGNYNERISELKDNISYNMNLLNASYDAYSSTIPSNDYTVPSYTYSGDDDYSNNYNYDILPLESYTLPAIDCDSYHSQYYQIYQQNVSNARQSYNNAVSDASLRCAGNGGSYGGCVDLQKGKLEQTLNSEIAGYRSTYKTSMMSVGCAPSDYVDF